MRTDRPTAPVVEATTIAQNNQSTSTFPQPRASAPSSAGSDPYLYI